jgi:hypothetical protein
MRKAVSVTIDEDNLLWLRAQAAATSDGSVSGVLDRLVREARLEGRTEAVRSVVGTVDLPQGNLDHADAHVRSLFERSLSRPMLVTEGRPRAARASRPRTKKRRG